MRRRAGPPAMLWVAKGFMTSLGTAKGCIV